MPNIGRNSYTAGKFALDLDGMNAGWLQSADGGHAVGDVITEKVGVDNIAFKHLGAVKFEDISVNCGTGMSKSVYEWIKASFDKSYQKKNGAIIACDYDFNEVSRMDFYDSLISEVGFPALDSKQGVTEGAKMALKLRPFRTKSQKITGTKVDPSKYSLAAGKQKKWTTQNFRLRIDGLEEACKKVSKIDAITLKQKTVVADCGEERCYQVEPSSLEVPNLSITADEAYAQQLYQWHEDFVITGNCGQEREKTATLEFLTPAVGGFLGYGQAQEEILFTLTFHGLGIYKLTPDKVESNNEAIRKIKAEMYCERIEFQYAQNAVWA